MADRDELVYLIANEVAEAISNMDAGNRVADAILESEWLAGVKAEARREALEEAALELRNPPHERHAAADIVAALRTPEPASSAPDRSPE